MTDAGSEEDFGHTSEVAAIDEEILEATAARPQRPSEVSTASGLDQTGMNPMGEVPGEDDDVLIADDLADLVELDEGDVEEHPNGLDAADATEQGEKPQRKPSSVPPPLPRS